MKGKRQRAAPTHQEPIWGAGFAFLARVTASSLV